MWSRERQKGRINPRQSEGRHVIVPYSGIYQILNAKCKLKRYSILKSSGAPQDGLLKIVGFWGPFFLLGNINIFSNSQRILIRAPLYATVMSSAISHTQTCLESPIYGFINLGQQSVCWGKGLGKRTKDESGIESA